MTPEQIAEKIACWHEAGRENLSELHPSGKAYQRASKLSKQIAQALRNHAKELLAAAEQNARLVEALERITADRPDDPPLTWTECRGIARAVLEEVRNG